MGKNILDINRGVEYIIIISILICKHYEGKSRHRKLSNKRAGIGESRWQGTLLNMAPEWSG